VARPSDPRVLAVVPARGGSKGLPRKNLRELAGLSLLEHALRFAATCPQISRTIVSTDSDEIAAAARAAGGDVPFLRPPELARDETPMWPVLGHALAAVDPAGDTSDVLVLLDPTSPAREPGDLARALELLAADPAADGVVAVAEPPFNPIWHGVVEREGYLRHLLPEGARHGRRQDVERVRVICGVLYAWRTAFVRSGGESWFDGRHLPLEVPWERAVSIDDERDLALLEAVVSAGLVRLPWLPP
jgi:N-acylneuraminate cytidylyltransferase